MPLVALTVEQLDYLAQTLETAAKYAERETGLGASPKVAELVDYLRGHAEMAKKPLVPSVDEGV